MSRRPSDDYLRISTRIERFQLAKHMVELGQHDKALEMLRKVQEEYKGDESMLAEVTTLLEQIQRAQDGDDASTT